MVFVCDHCHFELEAVAKPSQCPDCGKLGHIRTATAEESQAFQARKLEDVWHDSAPALAGLTRKKAAPEATLLGGFRGRCCFCAATGHEA